MQTYSNQLKEYYVIRQQKRELINCISNIYPVSSAEKLVTISTSNYFSSMTLSVLH